MGLFLRVNDKDGNSVQLIDALVEEGLLGCSLSMAHYDREVNDGIMNFRGSYKGLDETQLRHLASLSSTTFSPRLSCVLTPDGIHTEDELLKYIEQGKSLGFKKFIFRVGTGIPDEFATKGDFAEYNASTALNIDIFVNELMKSHGFKEIFSLHKSDSHVHVLGDGEIVLDFDQSSEEPDPDSKVRRFIYMPDGVTYTSWIDSSRLLFDDNIDIIKASVVAQLTKKLKGASPSVTHKRKQLKRIQSAEEGERFPVDLHVHTLNSDGRSTSMEVIRSAARDGFKIVFAEHNFVADMIL